MFIAVFLVHDHFQFSIPLVWSILLVTKKVIFFGKNPCSGIKRILLLHNPPRQFEINTKKILPSKLIATRKMINPLIAFKSLDKFLSNIGVNPKQKDIIKMILLIVKLVAKILMNQIMN